jgi:hypothetical protein
MGVLRMSELNGIEKTLEEVYMLSFERTRTLVVGWVVLNKSCFTEREKVIFDELIKYLDSIEPEVLIAFKNTFNQINESIGK